MIFPRLLSFVLESQAKAWGQDSWHQLEIRLGQWCGEWINREALPGVTWLQVIAAATVLLLTAAVTEIIRWRVRRQVRAAAGSPDATPRHSALVLTLRDAHSPLRLLIWVWGAYLAFHFLLFHLPFDTNIALTALVWFRKVGMIIAVFWFLYRMVNVLELELRRWAARATSKGADILATVVARALRLVVPLIGVLLVIPSLELPPAEHALVQSASSLLLIGFVGFVFCELAATAEQAVLANYRVDVSDNLATRKIQTQVKILRKTGVALIVLVTVALMLTVFEPVRALGKSILATAGVAGIVIGIAAQRTLATVLAGIQIAFAQPIRLDDVVIVEGEWGRIEEITLTYVVVAIWDLRRMVLPITYFIEKPFQNWTRASADLLGSVFLYMDYTVPIAPLRAELDRILETTKLWDRKVKVLQVTDAKEKTIEIRILVSAANSSIAWDLRCEVREKMVDFLQRHYPQSLPRTRAVLQDGSPEGTGGEDAVGRKSQTPAAAPPASGTSDDGKSATDTVSSSLGIHKETPTERIP